jgi:hypothetical protein
MFALLARAAAATATAAAPASIGFLGIDWGAFALVFAVALVAAVAIVAFYALGLRLLAVGSPDDQGADGAITSSARGARPVTATVGAFVCFAIGVGAVLYSLYLIIPQFH